MLPCHIWPRGNRMGLSCYFYSRLSFYRTFVWLPTPSPSSSLPLTALHVHDSKHAKSHQQGSHRGRENTNFFSFYLLRLLSLTARAGWRTWFGCFNLLKLLLKQPSGLLALALSLDPPCRTNLSIKLFSFKSSYISAPHSLIPNIPT